MSNQLTPERELELLRIVARHAARKITGEYLDLVAKYSGTKFESDPAYQRAKVADAAIRELGL